MPSQSGSPTGSSINNQKSKIKNEKPSQGKLRGLDSGWNRDCLNADDVGCLEPFRSFKQIELHRLALVQRAVTVLLDGGEVNENIFPGGALDQSIPISPVEPLYCALLSHKETPFASAL